MVREKRLTCSLNIKYSGLLRCLNSWRENSEAAQRPKKIPDGHENSNDRGLRACIQIMIFSRVDPWQFWIERYSSKGWAGGSGMKSFDGQARQILGVIRSFQGKVRYVCNQPSWRTGGGNPRMPNGSFRAVMPNERWSVWERFCSRVNTFARRMLYPPNIVKSLDCRM